MKKQVAEYVLVQSKIQDWEQRWNWETMSTGKKTISDR